MRSDKIRPPDQYETINAGVGSSSGYDGPSPEQKIRNANEEYKQHILLPSLISIIIRRKGRDREQDT